MLALGVALLLLTSDLAMANRGAASGRRYASSRPAALTNRGVISSGGGPLTDIWIGADLSCQVAHSGSAQLEFFPSSAAAADCGTLLATGGQLFGPDFAQNPNGTSTPFVDGAGSYTAFTPTAQSLLTGAGTASSPSQLTTEVAAGITNLNVRETDSYVAGTEYYRSDITISNTGSSAQRALLYRAGDCSLGGHDSGYGFVVPSSKAPTCAANPNNSPAGDAEQFVPITAGSHYFEGLFSTGWADIRNQTDLPDTCDCTTPEDNGAGINWDVSVPAGGSSTFSLLSNFSVVAPPPPVLGKSADIVPVSGHVFVKPPAGHARDQLSGFSTSLTKGNGFVPLTEARQVPLGSQIDTRAGTISLTTATGVRHGARLQTGTFNGGVFTVSQSVRRIQKGLTTLSLVDHALPAGPGRSACKAQGASGFLGAGSARANPVLQVLHASDKHGSYRTRGRGSAATVRGTVWTTADQCSGTLTRVQRGTVSVYDYHRRKTIILHAGHSYLARLATPRHKKKR